MEKKAATQSAWGQIDSKLVSITLPCAQSELMPGVYWGLAEDLFTPAFWKYQVRMQHTENRYTQHRLGRSLPEEVAVCLLGGYGMPAELGFAAFKRLQEMGLLDRCATASNIEQALNDPFLISGKFRKYRFPRQKARYLSGALATLFQANVPDSPVELRDFLTTLEGVGPKTASWVVRNHLGTDDVAILDVHIIRAGIHIGLYEEDANPARQYYHMEKRFLDFCRAIEEPASVVDAIMWDFMRRLGRISWAKARPAH